MQQDAGTFRHIRCKQKIMHLPAVLWTNYDITVDCSQRLLRFQFKEYDPNFKSFHGSILKYFVI